MGVRFRITPGDSGGKGEPDDTGEFKLVNILGDYNDDGRVDDTDLGIFRTVWDQQDTTRELGPATGVPPDFTLIPDGRIDFEDLAVFSLMWRWSAEESAAAPTHVINTQWKSPAPSTEYPTFSTDGGVLNISLPTHSLMGYVSIEYDASMIGISFLRRPSYRNSIFLSNIDRPGRAILAFADLEAHPSGKSNAGIVRMAFDLRADAEDASIVCFYDIRDIDNRKVVSGTEVRKIYRLPKAYALLQNYPNPSNPETWIPFQLAQDANVVIKIYTSAGQLVRTLDMEHEPAGFYISKERAAYWDGRNESGEELSSGVYFYTINAGDFTAIRRMLMLK
jgi:hypothetical protein